MPADTSATSSPPGDATPLQDLTRRVAQAIDAAYGADAAGASPAVAASQNPQFGDYQSNAAMQLAGLLKARTGQKSNPREVAERLVEELKRGGVEEILIQPPQIAGPGFINFMLAPGYISARLDAAASDQHRLAVPPATPRQKVVVEYSSPNIAKQMHVGHIRSTILGDAAARILDFLGHEVVRQNHVGDWGTQFGRLVLAFWWDASAKEFGWKAELEAAVSQVTEAVRGNDVTTRREVIALLARRTQESLHRDMRSEYFANYAQQIPVDLPELERLYRFACAVTDTPLADEFIIHHAVHGDRTLRQIPSLVVTFIQGTQGSANEHQEKPAHAQAVRITMDEAARMYERLQVTLRPGDERGESFYNPRLASLADELEAAGVAEISEGALVSFAGGFKAPLMIRKSDGGFGYGTTDLAAVEFRARCDRIDAYGRKGLCADRVIYFVDARQGQHFKQVFATARAAAEKLDHWRRVADVELEHASFGSVLGEDGTPIKTREGESVKLADLLDEAERRALGVVRQKNPDLPDAEARELARAVGIGAVKYADLSKDRTSDYVFSYDQMLSLEGNTAPYLQYACARIRSILRKAATDLPDLDIAACRVVELSQPQELNLARHLIGFGDVVHAVARDLKPHLLCTWLYELATRFSGFYENCPVLRSEGPTRQTRLALTNLTGLTLARGLDLLGIAHPERM